MSRKNGPQVVTANDLFEGDAIWQTADGSWSRQMTDAEVIWDKEEAEARLAVAAAQVGQIVGAYLVDADPTPEGPKPTHFREEFRTRGPSNYAHGKQTEL